MTVKGSPFIMKNTSDKYITNLDTQFYEDTVFNLKQTIAKLKHELFAKDDVITQLKYDLEAERHVSAQLEAHISEFESQF